MVLKNYDFNLFSKFIDFCKNNNTLLSSPIFESLANSINFYKNGSKIKIKEKNKGSFTRYCGGNVTEECIRRGKNSPSPAIRKKATFAANARKWKHLNGGLITPIRYLNSNKLTED